MKIQHQKADTHRLFPGFIFNFKKGESAYIDPETEYSVFTESFLKQRGSCCGNGCRHVSADLNI